MENRPFLGLYQAMCVLAQSFRPESPLLPGHTGEVLLSPTHPDNCFLKLG